MHSSIRGGSGEGRATARLTGPRGDRSDSAARKRTRPLAGLPRKRVDGDLPPVFGQVVVRVIGAVAGLSACRDEPLTAMINRGRAVAYKPCGLAAVVTVRGESRQATKPASLDAVEGTCERMSTRAPP